MKDGGPAFPRSIENGMTCGMTLRDYFAAAALPGVMAGQIEIRKCGGEINTETAHEDAAEVAYQIADAMVARRCK